MHIENLHCDWNNDMVSLVNQKITENRRVTMIILLHVSRTVLHEIVTDQLVYPNLCFRWARKMLTGEHKTTRLGSSVTFVLAITTSQTHQFY